MTQLITRKLQLALSVFAAAVIAASCTPELTDTGAFALYYPGITDIGPSTNMDLSPSWHGGTPQDFEIYKVTLEGETVTAECFGIDPSSGVFQIRRSEALAVGKYSISVACSVGGARYEFPDAITVNMMRAIPEGITVTPDKLTLTLSDVTSTSSSAELPTAQITTEGEHISIKNYLISAIRRDGQALSEWSDLFSINKQGQVSVLKNSSFKPGVYVLDFKLTTMVVDAESTEGIFANALTVEIASAPVALEFSPSEIKVEQDKSYTTSAPDFTGSISGLSFSLKATSPQTDKISVDAATGAVTVAENNGLPVGTEVLVSLSAKNDYGTRDFDQVLKVIIVDYIAPITEFSYRDSTVWEGTKVKISPEKMDGDEVTYSFVDLPESLSGQLSLDSSTGEIVIAKGNSIAKGAYPVKIKVENAKGALTTSFLLSVIANPYAFTYVRWGNNLGLDPIANYASQHRVSVTDPVEIPVVETDIKDGVAATFSIKGGSNTNCVTIDAATGKLTTVPSAFTKTAERRAHFVFVVVTTGEGTSGETSLKIPVFFDFNDLRGEYRVEYTPFAILCNPKTGVTSTSPVITKGGVALTDEELKSITMDFRRSFNYWNLNGPSAHKNGAPNANKDTFLSSIWAAYYSAINVAYNSGSRDPMSTYGRSAHVAKCAGYVRQEDRALYIAPEKFVDDNGYANGIFTGQITMGLTGADPAGAADPYRLFPLFVWFDTQF